MTPRGLEDFIISLALYGNIIHECMYHKGTSDCDRSKVVLKAISPATLS